jgi:hypothetical protein
MVITVELDRLRPEWVGHDISKYKKVSYRNESQPVMRRAIP